MTDPAELAKKAAQVLGDIFAAAEEILNYSDAFEDRYMLAQAIMQDVESIQKPLEELLVEHARLKHDLAAIQIAGAITRASGVRKNEIGFPARETPSPTPAACTTERTSAGP